MQRCILVLMVLCIASIGLACCELPVDPSAPATASCLDTATVMEPAGPMISEYAAGEILDPGQYDIWCGKQNSGGSIGWKAYGPIHLSGETSYVFDVVNKELSEGNPRGISVYPNQVVTTYKRSYDAAYGVCLGMII